MQNDIDKGIRAVIEYKPTAQTDTRQNEADEKISKNFEKGIDEGRQV